MKTRQKIAGIILFMIIVCIPFVLVALLPEDEEAHKWYHHIAGGAAAALIGIPWIVTSLAIGFWLAGEDFEYND